MSVVGGRIEAAGSAAPRFSVRFENGRASVVLAQPLVVESGRIEALEIDLGPLPRGVDLSRGWRGLRHRRGVATRARIVVDVASLAARVPGLSLVGMSETGFLFVLARAHGHVAFELSAAIRGTDLLLWPSRARCAVDGPRSPTAEALSIASELGARFDPELGAIALGDPMRDVLTDALAPAGMRIPHLDPHRRGPPELVSGGLELCLADVEKQHPPLEAEIALAPVRVAIAEGSLAHARDLLRERRGPEAEALSDEVALELGAPGDLPSALDAAGASRALRDAKRRRDLEAAARAARALDGHERAAPVAVEGLLSAAELARSLDPAVEAELLGRALGRSPDDPRVLAAGAPLPTGGLGTSLLRTLERSASLRVRDVATEQAAIGRLRLALGDPPAATAAFERAVRAAPGSAALLEGLAEARTSEGSLDAAGRAWLGAAEKWSAAGEPALAARAQLRAAELEASRGRPEEALVLARRADTGGGDAFVVEIHALVARLTHAVGDTTGREAAERALVAIADRGEPSARARVRDVLAAAVERHPSRGLLEALARLDPRHPALGEASAAIDRAAFAEIEAAGSTAAEVARRLSERLRAEGRIDDAARALLRAGEILGDAATLRAAVDLAERGSDPAVRSEIVERALRVVGDGPAREALLRRRPSPKTP